jgi:hypothetical protein
MTFLLAESRLQLLPIELPAEPALQQILTLDSTEAELCPHFAFKNFALANPDKTRYSAPWRVACGVDFYGGDMSAEPVSTNDGSVGCAIICQQTSRCRGTVFRPSDDNLRSGSCYLKKSLSNPISRPGFAAVVRRNDLKPDLALMTSKRFFEGQRYDAIADVYDIDTDDGEHHPHPKLFDNYVDRVMVSGSTSTNVVVSTSPSPLTSSATTSIATSTSTSSQVTISLTPIYFSTLPNSVVVPFVPAPLEVASSTRSTFPTVVVSSPMASIVFSSLQTEGTMLPTSIGYVTAVVPRLVANINVPTILAEDALSATGSNAIPKPSPSTLATVLISQWPARSASHTSLVLSSPFPSVASPSRPTDPAESEMEPTVKPVSTFSVYMAGFPTEAEWKPATTASVSNNESTQATASSEVHLEGFPTDAKWKPAATTSVSNHASDQVTSSFKAHLESFSTDDEWKSAPTVSRSSLTFTQATSSFKMVIDGFPTDIEWKPASTGFLTGVESYQSSLSTTETLPESTLAESEATITRTSPKVTGSSLPHFSEKRVEPKWLIEPASPASTREPEVPAKEAEPIQDPSSYLKYLPESVSYASEAQVSELPTGSDTVQSFWDNEEAAYDLLLASNVEDAARESTAAPMFVDVPEPTTALPVSFALSSTSAVIPVSPTRSLGVSDRMRAQDKKLTHSLPFEPIELDDYLQDARQDGAETSEAKPTSPPKETLTKYLVSTVSVSPALVTRMRMAEPKVSSAQYVFATEIAMKPTVPQLFPTSEPATSQDFHETATAIDAAPTKLAMLTATLLATDVPAQATQTIPCAQFGQSCESMVVVFAPLGTLESPSKEGASVPSFITASTTVAAAISSPSPESWPTRTLQVADNIMPAVNPMTVACALGPSDVDCNKFASIVMWVKPMATLSLPAFKTVVTHKPTEHAITKSPGSWPTSAPFVAVPQAPPVHLPVPVQTSYPIAVPVTPLSSPVRVHSPPSPPSLPPSVSESEASSTYVLTPTIAPSNRASLTMIPINPLPSATAIVPISPLASETGIFLISPLPSETGSIASSASLVPVSTLASASPPKSSMNPPGNEKRPGTGEDRTYYSTGTANLSATWFALLASLFAGALVMV